ncbi:MAG: hypothetical protein HY706_15660 [Candidatus Hydrogenedentes bacterium]|nr:hypothetical protein [Candidatus Hydrogenedentota bacterium]
MNRKKWYQGTLATLAMGASFYLASSAWVCREASAQGNPPPPPNVGAYDQPAGPPPPPPPSDPQGFGRPGPRGSEGFGPRPNQQHFGPPMPTRNLEGQHSRPGGAFAGPRGPHPGPGGPWNAPQEVCVGERPMPPQRPDRPQPPDPETLFMRIDTNGDGLISREEFRDFHHRQRPPQSPMDPRHDEQRPASPNAPNAPLPPAPPLSPVPGQSGSPLPPPPSAPGQPAGQPPPPPGNEG